MTARGARRTIHDARKPPEVSITRPAADATVHGARGMQRAPREVRSPRPADGSSDDERASSALRIRIGLDHWTFDQFHAILRACGSRPNLPVPSARAQRRCGASTGKEGTARRPAAGRRARGGIKCRSRASHLERIDAELAAQSRAEAALRLRLGQALEVLGRGACFELGFSSLDGLRARAL